MDPSTLGAVVRGPEMQMDPESYYDGADAWSSSGEEYSSSGSGGGGSGRLGLESMTGKGIKCLCSELLELKKSSVEDFEKNVYSSYSTFIRVFKEFGDVESELMEFKRHVSVQKRLVKDLVENFCMDRFFEDLLESKVENDLNDGNHLLSKRQTHAIGILEKLDILFFDQQFEEALDILETENETLQNIDREGDQISAESFASQTSALSEWRTRLANQLASMAGHPRVTAPELQKSLSLLCRLGESCLANSLLIQFYHSQLVNHMHDLQCSKSLLNGVYMIELAKITFSVISQAARSFVMLHGETSPYSSEFNVWVMEEIKMFIYNFDLYIKSIHEKNGDLHLAVESLKCAFSFCSLLKPQRLVLHPYLTKSIQPCMIEVLQMHVDYLRKTIHIFTAVDTWIIGKFVISGMVMETSSLVGDRCELKCYWLTSSGRKFTTIIQAILEDISPLCSFQMESLILKALADLFSEYIKVLECSIPGCGNSIEKDPPRISSAQNLSQQLSLLVNTWTLVDYLFSIVKCIFNGIRIPSDEQILDTYEASRCEELSSWFFSIQDAADQLRGFFCQKFIQRYISATAKTTRGGSESYVNSLDLATSSQVAMPSNEFQMFFQQLQRLEKCGKYVFGGADENVEKLLEDLMGSVVAMVSNNVNLSGYNEHSSPIEQSICVKQFLVDIHFLIEIARFGGYLSYRLKELLRSLVASVESSFFGSDSTTCAATDVAWASTVAKAAIQKLVIEVTKLEPDVKRINACEEDFDYQSAQASSEHNVTESAELSDGEFEDITKPQKIKKSGSNPLDGITVDLNTRASDEEDFSSPPFAYIHKTWISESEEIRQT